MRSLVLRTCAIALLTIGTLTSCVHQPVPVSNAAFEGEFVTRHTMRGQQDGLRKTIYRSNYLIHPDVIPAGSRARIQMYSSLWIDAEIDGIPCRIRHRDVPFPVSDDGIFRFLDKHFARDAAALGLDLVSESNRNLIELGRAAVGMTKEEVMLAIGYPSHIDGATPTADLSRERILKSNLWIYRYQEIAFVPVTWSYQFGTDGRLLQRDPP